MKNLVESLFDDNIHKDLVFGDYLEVEEWECEDVDKDLLDTVRKRRPDARYPRRRLRDSLLCIFNARRQGDAVLRCESEPRKVPAVRYKRRRGRKAQDPGRTKVQTCYR